ncbi:YqcI/YcgG family protein [Natrinema pallidum]|uniref:YqcI/YcgG family protein n=1 Tax=Natrinema pallidum TaxID=69527 RepID=A0A4P9TBT3_9EURY|nr:YqcI/YcgG family protein [Natrinema pallidum]QCW01957.1 YqcI/YcgG family protein [Natrinema pallidum]
MALVGKIHTKDEVETKLNEGMLDGWEKASYEGFRDSLVKGNSYPCHFGSKAQRQGNARYLFIESMSNENDLMMLRDGIYEYIKMYEEIAKRTTLAIFFKPPQEKLSESEYRDSFWSILEYLNKNDPEPWPAEVPVDPDDPKWEFCFAGEPIFLVARAPCYEQRLSRYAPHGLEITVQPRGTLNDITGDTEKGKKAREIIRAGLQEYDKIDPHPDIGDYGDSNTREWKQYFLPDTNDESICEFPFEIDPK